MTVDQETESLAEQIKKLTAKELANGTLEEIIEEGEEQEIQIQVEAFLQRLEWELDNAPIGELYKRLRELIDDFRACPQRFG